jgi:hypothetical protein
MMKVCTVISHALSTIIWSARPPVRILHTIICDAINIELVRMRCYPRSSSRYECGSYVSVQPRMHGVANLFPWMTSISLQGK